MPSSNDAHGRHRFVMGPLLGSGTFGEVYLARMTSLHGIEQDVAVKLLNSGLDPRSQPVSRMRDEGRLLAGLNHPAILQVMDLCNLDGRIGLVTELVPGADLDDCIHGADPLPPRAALQVVGAVADALHAASDARTADGLRLGLVHRDIKPANVRVTPHGSVKLLDFGIAKSEDLQRETSTQQRAAFGTPAYMAPEVLSYEVLDALSSRDVFALGCTLYEALVGERYFEGLDHQAIGRLSTRLERFQEWRLGRMGRLATLPPEVVELLDRMLAYDHTERPSAREVAEACLEAADRLSGPSLWAWARQRSWRPLGEGAGPWTGRTVVDTRFGLGSEDGAPWPEAVGAPVAPTRSLPLVAPRARLSEDTVTSPPAGEGLVLPTLIVLAGGALALGALAALAVVWLRTDAVVDLLGGGEPPRAAAAQVGPRPLVPPPPAVDTGIDVRPTPDGSPPAHWGAGERGREAVTVRLVGEHPVRLLAPGRAPIRLGPHGAVRVPQGPIEVQARFDDRAWQWQFERVLVPGHTLAIACDPELARCDPLP